MPQSAHRDKQSFDLNHKQVLVVRLSALGDVTRTVPAVLALTKAFPQAQFTWLVENTSAPLLRGIPDFEILEIDRAELRKGGPLRRFLALRKLVAQVKARKFDCSIDFHGVFKSALIPYWAGIPLRMGFEKGFSKEGSRFLINRRCNEPYRSISRYQRNILLSRWLAPNADVEAVSFPVSVAGKEHVRHLMREQPILFFPGTSAHGRNKRWPAAYWAALYRRVSTHHKVSFVFGPADQAYQDALSAEIDGLPHLPPLKLPELTYALRQARMLVACDSGPMHMASVQGVPLVALMGPSDSVLNQPWDFGKSRMVLPGVPCAPCRHRKCEVLICQSMITPARAAEAVFDVLAALQREGEGS